MKECLLHFRASRPFSQLRDQYLSVGILQIAVFRLRQFGFLQSVCSEATNTRMAHVIARLNEIEQVFDTPKPDNLCLSPACVGSQQGQYPEPLHHVRKDECWIDKMCRIFSDT